MTFEEQFLAEDVAALVAKFSAVLWTEVVNRGGAAQVLLALAQCSGEFIGMDAVNAEHLRECLSAFAASTSQQAHNVFTGSSVGSCPVV